MPKYTIPQVSKALIAGAVATVGAAATAAGGPDLAALDAGQWAIALGAGLTAFGGVFRVPNAEIPPTVESAVADIARGGAAMDVLREHAATAQQTVEDAVAGLGKAVAGPLAAAVDRAIRETQ